MDIQSPYRRRGVRLKNGAVTLEINGDYVLAHRKNEAALPFAVWAFDLAEAGAVCAGRYYSDLDDAREDLTIRANPELEETS